MLFRLQFVSGILLASPNPGRDRRALGTRIPRIQGEEKGVGLEARSPRLVRRRVAELGPQTRIPTSNAMIGAPLRLADDKGQVGVRSTNVSRDL